MYAWSAESYRKFRLKLLRPGRRVDGQELPVNGGLLPTLWAEVPWEAGLRAYFAVDLHAAWRVLQGDLEAVRAVRSGTARAEPVATVDCGRYTGIRSSTAQSGRRC
jgi:hypothetical protein